MSRTLSDRLLVIGSHTEAALDRLLKVAESEVGSLQERLAGQQAAVDTLQSRLRAAEGEVGELRAKRELNVRSPVADAKARALQEEVEALQVKVTRVESAMKVKEDAHANEIQTWEVVLRATELELENARRKQGQDFLRYFYDDGEGEENGVRSGALTVDAIEGAVVSTTRNLP